MFGIFESVTQVSTIVINLQLLNFFMHVWKASSMLHACVCGLALRILPSSETISRYELVTSMPRSELREIRPWSLNCGQHAMLWHVMERHAAPLQILEEVIAKVENVSSAFCDNFPSDEGCSTYVLLLATLLCRGGVSAPFCLPIAASDQLLVVWADNTNASFAERYVSFSMNHYSPPTYEITLRIDVPCNILLWIIDNCYHCYGY